MRITGGTLRGRIIKAPDGRDVRPTTDKVRLAIFNIINGYEMAEDPFVLDGFCGTGALGIEALSRFARGALFIDKARKSINYARNNVDLLGLEDKAKFISSDVSKLGARPADVPPADLLFLDPPYRKDLLVPSLEALSQHGWLADQCLCVLECEKEAHIDLSAVFEPRDDRTYGDSRILIARYKTS